MAKQTNGVFTAVIWTVRQNAYTRMRRGRLDQRSISMLPVPVD